MMAHIYPSVLQAVSGRGYAGCLEGCFQGYRGEAMQDLGYELPRIPILRGWVNKALLVCPLALRGPIRTQPQRDVLRLHCVPYHTHQVVAKGIQIRLVPELR